MTFARSDRHTALRIREGSILTRMIMIRNYLLDDHEYVADLRLSCYP
jgi:hypothetical protein